MSDKYFVDTNILMYAHDAAGGVKQGQRVANSLFQHPRYMRGFGMSLLDLTISRV